MNQKTQSITVYDKPNGGVPLTLTDADKIGGGGQGTVYAKKLDNGVEAALKIFNDRQSSDLADKIHRMVDLGRDNAGEIVKNRHIAWPQLVIYDESGAFVGYAMKRAKGEPLRSLAHPMLAQEKFPDIDRDKVAKMLIRLWKTVDVLHKRNIFIGDVNLGNFLCTPDYQPCLIDTDSYQVGQWKCPVGVPEMTPPEHLDGRYEEITRTRESDLYSLAILSFQCLMLGKHPFEHIGGGTGVENQRRGRTPYLKGYGAQPGEKGGVPLGPWWTYWSNYPNKVKTLFDRALQQGRSAPQLRPTAKEWAESLEKYRYMLIKPHAKFPNGELFQHTSDIRPNEPKPDKLPSLSKEEFRRAEFRELRKNPPPLEALEAPDEDWGLIDNPTPRIIISLVVDTSDSMAGQRMDEMNARLRGFIEKITDDDYARFATEIEVFACGGGISRFSAASGDEWRDFSANGDARLGAGVVNALDTISVRINQLKEQGVSVYQPWLVLLTASDPADDCSSALNALANLSQPVEVFAVGIGAGYTGEMLAKFSKRPPLRVEEQKLEAFFDWLTRCMSEVSQSVPTYQRPLPPTNAWAAAN